MESIFLVLCIATSALAQPGWPSFPDITPGGEGGLPGGPPVGGGAPPIIGGPGIGLPGGQPFCPEFGIFRMPDMNSCGGYIQCDNGRSKPNVCSPGTHFSVERGICMPADVANCDLCRFNRNAVLFIPKEGSCSEYHVCFGRTRQTFRCAKHMQFNPRTRQCDHEDIVNCVDPQPESRECPRNDRLSFLPSLKQCDGYFVCSRGDSFYTQCHDSLIFDIETNRCVTKGRCLLDHKPSCRQQHGITFEAHPYHCQHYYLCEQNKPSLRACAPGLMFDIVSSRCNTPEHATCALPPEELNAGRPVWPTEEE